MTVVNKMSKYLILKTVVNKMPKYLKKQKLILVHIIKVFLVAD